MMSRFSTRNGITRREVALVIASLCALLAVALPYTYRARYFARRQVCEARHYRASLALIQTAIDNRQFPGYRNLQAVDARGNSYSCSWVFPILPYIHPLDEELIHPPRNLSPEMAADNWLFYGGETGPIANTGPYAGLYNDFGPAGNDTLRGATPDSYIPELMCPDDPKSGAGRGSLLSLVANCGMPDATPTSEYPADWHNNGVFTDQMPGAYRLAAPMTLEYLESKDGLANVIMLSENIDAGRWTDSSESKVGFVWTVRHSDAPLSLFKEVWDFDEGVGEGKGTVHSARPSSAHIKGFNVSFCNGATRFVTDDIDHLAWIWMLMPDAESPRYPGTDQVLAEALLRPRRTQPDALRNNNDASNGRRE